MTRHREIEHSPLIAAKLPVMSAAMRACRASRHPQPRHHRRKHRRTRIPRPNIRCSPSFYDATIKVQGPKGRRDIAGGTVLRRRADRTLEPEEIVYEIEFPILSSHDGWGFEEVARRFGDFALGCIAVSIRNGAVGLIGDARVAVMGVDETPRRLVKRRQCCATSQVDDRMPDDSRRRCDGQCLRRATFTSHRNTGGL